MEPVADRMPDPAPNRDAARTAEASGTRDRSDRFAADLRQAAAGDGNARRRLWELHYETLRDCARSWLARNWRRRGEDFVISLGGTAIVDDVWERLHDRTAAMENGKTYFFRAFYTECMRIAVDHYRRTRDDKGRGDGGRVELQSQFFKEHDVHVDLATVYDLVEELVREDEELGCVAMLKIFESRSGDGQPGSSRGLTNDEVAEILGIGLRTVEKRWSFAKAWLLRRLGGDGNEV